MGTTAGLVVLFISTSRILAPSTSSNTMGVSRVSAVLISQRTPIGFVIHVSGAIPIQPLGANNSH
jgi:hypothetical protein